MRKKVLVSLAASAILVVAGVCAPASAVSASAVGEKRYYDHTVVNTRSATTEYVYYTDRVDNEVTTAYGVPYYYVTGSTMTNACGAVAGTTVVGFYDRYYENLIAGYTPYYASSLKYRLQDGTYVPAVMQEMYTLMRTNVDDVGVSESDCKNGLKTYFSNKGLTLSYSSVKSGSSFSYSLYKQAIQANKPVLLFCTDLSRTAVGFNENQASITTTSTTGSHIIVGYGYYTVEYYNNGTLFRTDDYILASNGQSTIMNICVDLSDTSWFDSGYAVSVS
ncbi:MAG: hypothetical protein IJ506_05835 [Clostridia bacterium]|nr:hypothetical protein [Clostridia bacterium]